MISAGEGEGGYEFHHALIIILSVYFYAHIQALHTSHSTLDRTCSDSVMSLYCRKSTSDLTTVTESSAAPVASHHRRRGSSKVSRLLYILLLLLLFILCVVAPPPHSPHTRPQPASCDVYLVCGSEVLVFPGTSLLR